MPIAIMIILLMIINQMDYTDGDSIGRKDEAEARQSG